MKTVEYEFNGVGVRERAARVDHDAACRDAVGREMVVPVDGGRYRGVVSQCDYLQGSGRYRVWLRCGEYVHGPFIVEELPDA